MEFGHLIEYNMRNIFHEKSYIKNGRKTIPLTFSKKSKLSIFLYQQSEVLYSLYLLHVQVESYHNILKLSYKPLPFNLYKAFLKNKNEVWN